MVNFYGAARRAAKDLRVACVERDKWKACAESLQRKLDERSDFFIEREMRLVDRFLTSQAKTYAITDEIKSKITERDVKDAALDEFLAEKKEFLVECARDAGFDNPKAQANATFNQNYSSYVLEFEAQ